MTKLKDGERTTLIDHLIANAGMQEDDREHFEGLTDSSLLRVANLARNAKKSKGEEDDDTDTENRGGKAEGSNADTIGGTGTVQAGGEEDGNEVGGYKSKKGKGLEGGKKLNQRSMQDLLANATDEDREVWNQAEQVVKDAKVAVVRRLIANVANDEVRKAKGAKLMKKPLSELREMLELMPPPSRGQRQDVLNVEDEDEGAVFVGNAGTFAGGGTANAAGDDEFCHFGRGEDKAVANGTAK